MKHLSSLNKYFWKYKWHFLLGIIFIVLSNYFRILAPQVTKYVLNTVEMGLRKDYIPAGPQVKTNYDPLIKTFIQNLNSRQSTFKTKILYSGVTLLVLALISGNKVDLRPLITHSMKLSETVEGYNMFRQRQGGVLKIALRP